MKIKTIYIIYVRFIIIFWMFEYFFSFLKNWDRGGDHRKISHFYQYENNLLRLGTTGKFFIFINMRKSDGKQFSFPLFENENNQIIDKFYIKFTGNFSWIILNKICIEFKFVQHLRKILKTLGYFLMKFELISSIEVWICDYLFTQVHICRCRFDYNYISDFNYILSPHGRINFILVIHFCLDSKKL